MTYDIDTQGEFLLRTKNMKKVMKEGRYTNHESEGDPKIKEARIMEEKVF